MIKLRITNNLMVRKEQDIINILFIISNKCIIQDLDKIHLDTLGSYLSWINNKGIRNIKV